MEGRAAIATRAVARLIAEAQAISDRLGNYSRVQLDALLQIRGVQPGMSGGTLIADILEFELRESRGGTTIARVQVPGG